jgi:hypothetical protein
MKDGDIAQTGPEPKSRAGDLRLARHSDKDGGLFVFAARDAGLTHVNAAAESGDTLAS